jgi:hypothetical protein
MTKEEFYNTSVKGIAKVVKAVRETPGISKRSLLKRVDNKYACLAFLYLALCESILVEKKTLFGARYYPEGHR